MLPSWSLLEHAFVVETIMVPRTNWLYWNGEEPLQSLWGRASASRIDTVPVIKDDRVIGLLRQDQSEIVPLTKDWLIAHDTPISHTLQRFVSEVKPSLFVFQSKGVIVGIVTPADFNKAPARTFIYNLLVELEMNIAFIVGNHFSGRQREILELIKPKDKQEIVSAIEEMEKTDREIEIIHLLYLSDLVNILRKEESLRSNLASLKSSTQVQNQLGGLVHLRDDVVHPVRLLLGENRDISKLNAQVQRAQKLLGEITGN